MSSAPSRSSALAERLTAAADAIIAAVTPSSVVLIDGRSGAGKSSLAADLRARWPHSAGVQLVALDSLYPGWDGLEAGAAYACARILVPHAAGVDAHWQHWDWGRDRYADSATVRPDLALIVEGSGALTASTREYADVRVWLESPATTRRERAIARDGDTYRPHWDRWARQEDAHLRRQGPRSLATHVFDLP